MQASLVITILGNDHPGLVNHISSLMLTHKANWTDSRMINLSDKFAGILKVSTDADNIEALTLALKNLHDEDNNIHVLVELVDTEHKNNNTDTVQQQALEVEIVGQDRPGIIDEITQTLSALHINIEELHSEQQEASMAGGMLFIATMKLQLPRTMGADQVQDTLEELSNQLMLDIEYL